MIVNFGWPLLLLCCLGWVGDEPKDGRLEAPVTLDDEHLWPGAHDLEAWNGRAKRLRRQILVAAGLWPLPARTPLRPVEHSPIARPGYTVSKLCFESLPGFYVTGNLYRPAGEGPFPGVLSPHGHWQHGRLMERGEAEVRADIAQGGETMSPNGRYPLQARCAQLARMGCVVFHYDMVGYGDSTQLQHRSGFGDVEAELWSQNWFGLQTWNSLRALDFLTGLDEVDAQRIGVTGASGGGTQTFMLCAIDPRPTVAFPAVMVSTGMQGGCVCENASHLRVGTGNVELAALMAPRPLALSGANDWTVKIEENGLPPLKRLYRLFGHEDRVAAKCWPQFGHNYNRLARTHMYQWFNRHLDLGQPEPIVEQELVPIPPADLHVFDESHPRPSSAADIRGVRRWLRAEAERQQRDRLPNDRDGLTRFRQEVGGALRSLLHTDLPPEGSVEIVPGERLLLRRRGTSEAVPARLVLPERWNGTVVVAVGDLGEVEFGTAGLLAIEPLLTGKDGSAETLSLPVDGRRHGTFVGYTFGYNKTLLAERVHDILTGIAYARDLEGTRRVCLLGVGEAGPWTLLARALAEGAVARLAAEWSWSFAEIASLEDENFLPGALRHGGLSAFTALSAPGELRLLGRDALPEIVASVYHAASAPRSVMVAPAPLTAETVRWLRGE